jgi:hypothetical protein
MDMARLFATIVFAVVALTSLFALGVQLVRLSKKGSTAAHVLGATFMLMGFGNFRDPTNEFVQQAKQLKQREDDDSGDPPDDEPSSRVH